MYCAKSKQKKKWVKTNVFNETQHFGINNTKLAFIIFFTLPPLYKLITAQRHERVCFTSFRSVENSIKFVDHGNSSNIGKLAGDKNLKKKR